MSLYNIAASSLTTVDDHRRRPAIDAGQIMRTLVLCLLCAVAAMAMHRGAHGAGTASAANVQPSASAS